MHIRKAILRTAYKYFPFSLKGDMKIENTDPETELSCVINFYRRTHLLRNILSCLAEQDISKDKFEVVLIEDRNGTEEGKALADLYGSKLNIRYFTLQSNFGHMGFSRNLGVSKVKGKYVLLLDDDTVILQNDFIATLIKEFENTGADAIVPHGCASFSLIKDKYDYHDPYYPTSRCMGYTREVLGEMEGFVSDMVGQEDVEFVVRLNAARKKIVQSPRLDYYHPPLIVDNLRKPAAVGASFAKLRSRYPFLILLMLIMNGARHLPLLLLPFNKRFLMQGKFSLGFLLGVLYSVVGKTTTYS